MKGLKLIVLTAALWVLPAVALAAPIAVDGQFTDWIGQAHLTSPARPGPTRSDVAALYWASDRDLFETYWMVERFTTNRGQFNTYNGQTDPAVYYLHMDLNDNGTYTDPVDRLIKVTYVPMPGYSDVTVEVFDTAGGLLFQNSGDWGEPVEQGGQRVEWSLSLFDLDLAPDQRFRVYMASVPRLAVLSDDRVTGGEEGTFGWGEYLSKNRISFDKGATVAGIVESHDQLTFGEESALQVIARSRDRITIDDNTTGQVVADSGSQINVGAGSSLTARLYAISRSQIGNNVQISYSGTRILRSGSQFLIPGSASVTCDAAPCVEPNTAYQPGELINPTVPPLPTVNYSTLKLQAAERYTGNRTFTGFTDGDTRMVYVENGNVQVSGQVSGRVALVVYNGNVTVNGPLLYDDPATSGLTIVTTGTVTVESGVTLNAHIFSLPGGKVTLQDDVSLYGFIISGDQVILGKRVHLEPNDWAYLTIHPAMAGALAKVGDRVPAAGEIQLSEVPALGWAGLGVVLIIGAGMATTAMMRRPGKRAAS